MKKLLKKNKAFTLVETLVAISIFTVSFLAIMSVLASGISYTNNAKQKMIATFLAQEGIEYVRNMRDTDILYGSGNPWDQFKNKFNSCNNPSGCGFVKPSSSFNVSVCISINDCVLYLNNGSYSSYTGPTSGTNSGFTRKVWMDTFPPPNDNEVKIYSKVEWMQGSTPKSIIFSEKLFNLL